MINKLEIKKISNFNDLLDRGFDFNTYYESNEIYRPSMSVSKQEVVFKLSREYHPQQFIKMTDIERDKEWYAEVIERGLSIGIWLEDTMIGIAIVEPWSWNNTLQIIHIEVKKDYRRAGFGSKLLESVENLAKENGNRQVVVETQTTNVNAIDFYMQCGFTIDAMDVSLYTNHDLDKGEVGLFMKKAVE